VVFGLMTMLKKNAYNGEVREIVGVRSKMSKVVDKVSQISKILRWWSQCRIYRR